MQRTVSSRLDGQIDLPLNLNTAAVTFPTACGVFLYFPENREAFRHLEFLTGKSKVFLPKGLRCGVRYTTIATSEFSGEVSRLHGPEC